MAQKKQQKKATFHTDENIDIGVVEISESQGMKISLVRKDNARYIALTRVYKTKTENKWNPKSGVWIPFEKSKQIMQHVYDAYETGIALKWGQE